MVGLTSETIIINCCCGSLRIISTVVTVSVKITEFHNLLQKYKFGVKVVVLFKEPLPMSPQIVT
jgi:hypothetical protein